MMLDPQIFLVITVLIIAIVGVIYLVFTRPAGPSLNRQKYQRQWLAIENSLQRDNMDSYQIAILNADKLLDRALRDKHYRGETMGERMKSAQKVWRNANYIWGAHKVRNQLAHETEYVLTREVALRSLSAYKQALKDLGAF